MPALETELENAPHSARSQETCRPVVNGDMSLANVTGQLPSRLFYVSDRTTCLRFLVDTGAQVSIIPPSRTDCKNRPANLVLQGICSQVSSLSPTLLPRKPKNAFEELLAEFPVVTEPCNTEQLVKHNITHHITTSAPPPPSLHGPTGSPQNGSRSHVRSLITSCNLVLSSRHPAVGLLLCIWCQRRQLETGALVVTTAFSTTPQLQIATPSHIYRISPCHSMDLLSSPRSTWSWHTMKYPLSPRIFPKRRLPQPLDCSSSPECLSAYEMPRKHSSSVSLTRSSGGSPSVTCTLMICSLPVRLQRNTNLTSDKY